MSLHSSFTPSARPDLADRLLAAVAERDQPMAERLLQQWAHRRGLVSLDALLAGPLLASQGAEAVAWLQACAGSDGYSCSQSSPRSPVRDQRDAASDETAGPAPAGPHAPVVERETVHELVQPSSSVSLSGDGSLVRSWPQLAVVPDGAPAPTPQALAPLRAWLPDADHLPLAS